MRTQANGKTGEQTETSRFLTEVSTKNIGPKSSNEYSVRMRKFDSSNFNKNRTETKYSQPQVHRNDEL